MIVSVISIENIRLTDHTPSVCKLSTITGLKKKPLKKCCGRNK